MSFLCCIGSAWIDIGFPHAGSEQEYTTEEMTIGVLAPIGRYSAGILLILSLLIIRLQCGQRISSSDIVFYFMYLKHLKILYRC